jgi:dTDP-4-amino-4,6-dideoxygalactose transaminase
LNLDEKLLERAITRRTRAVIVVHYGGVACAMAPILAAAKRRGVPVVEDNAHGLFGKYRGQSLGTFGALSAQSFHETKNVSCGEGGALIINDPKLVARAEIIREKGTDRSRFFRGQVDKYSWVDVGSSYLPSDLLAAFLCAQLEKRRVIQARRRRIWKLYASELGSWAKTNAIGLPFVPDDCEQPWHMFYLLMPSMQKRQDMIAHLRRAGILAVFHYLPLHLSLMGRRFGGKPRDCPVTESVSDRLLRLPFYYGLSVADQMRVISAVKRF